MDIIDGWLKIARQCVSPNYNQRPVDTEIDLLVIHGISLPPGQFGGAYISQLFCNQLDHQAHAYFEGLRGLEVSSHLLIRRDGELIQYISCLDRAWHAGQSCFQGRENCNDFAIGIELEGTDDLAYTDEQYQQLNQVIGILQQGYPKLKVKDHIVGHADIAPGRKTDPGLAFDWQRIES